MTGTAAEAAGRHAVVVGAGIGGLAAAVGLHRAGWSVGVLERAPEVRPVGAGIALAPNGLRALDVLGLGDAVRRLASPQGAGGFREPGGRWLLRQDLGAVTAVLGDTFVVLRRADLVALLLGALPAGTVRTGVEVLAADPGDARRPATVTTADGRAQADLVVAADGLRSRLRGALFPGHPGTRPAGYVAWRLLPRVAPDVARLGQFETWGRGRRFSALAMAGGEVYCWATVSAPPGRPVADDRAELLRLFGGWHDPVAALVRATPAEAVLRHDVHELARPLPALRAGRVAFVGDAGHALTPDLGQGGGLALEDAAVLALRVGAAEDLDAALATWSAERLPRVTAIATRSRRLARVGQLSAPPLVALRALGLRTAGLVPAALTARALTPVVGWRPPVVG
ncbi:FAD-dependent monooxygenase [Cellulomonas endophytica]|uniref:FAD-dependent monooxygenase n=1 Tax=Cellulomonas endophytica TaxID=2494735 RepID=UPI0010129251|nr:FAD-dependent monooxygenase [Cellulomonas endophytica]